ncbi:addiction module toxin RelE [Chimaeribacter coloradensis]|uniref:Addiction module toxin RelE n=1 Tax=Chimaeribacter coloradensis TaxID=2060068 RepID=A0A2N5E804_9GAMM|nr:type II toxin-antitoxin system RelE/ParE family toxin [Chimaeribacter coloradensis]PLR37619.1 addiction module toxin RelE [Chimaeribacter coloradensis]
MNIYTTSLFDKSLKKQQISDKTLCEAAIEIKAGLVDARLGGDVYKKRIPLAGGGKRGGARTVIAFHYDRHLFFMDGWIKTDVPKDGTKEIPDDDLEAYRRIAKDLLTLSDEMITTQVLNGNLREVNCHEQTERIA